LAILYFTQPFFCGGGALSFFPAAQYFTEQNGKLFLGTGNFARLTRPGLLIKSFHRAIAFSGELCYIMLNFYKAGFHHSVTISDLFYHGCKNLSSIFCSSRLLPVFSFV
jgi:hypothetical protein